VNVMGVLQRLKEKFMEWQEYRNWRAKRAHPGMMYVLTGERADDNEEYEARYISEEARAKERKEKLKEKLSVLGAKAADAAKKGVDKLGKEMEQGEKEERRQRRSKKQDPPKLCIFSEEQDRKLFKEGYV
jgi:hypothetical protein